MTNEQAHALGQLLRDARKARDLSIARMAERLAIDESWIVRLETGRYTTPNPALVTRIVEHLGIDPASVDLVSGGLLRSSLPSVKTYFRSREALPPEALRDIEGALDEIRAKYGAPEQPRGEPEGTPGGRP